MGCGLRTGALLLPDERRAVQAMRLRCVPLPYSSSASRPKR